MASIKAVRLLNDMCILELQLSSSLHLLIQQTDEYSYNFMEYTMRAAASASLSPISGGGGEAATATKLP